ncbi:hypothetical protein [Paraglaciecola sp. 20A4]|uniref:hypothetical protein n=1 Tax=Paraglaciecola sp. 20A4 TaxID=2687288 RepID=UPI00140CB42A|nr:hypothetical protein [Paraglaciecola sp. 20A4]
MPRLTAVPRRDCQLRSNDTQQQEWVAPQVYHKHLKSPLPMDQVSHAGIALRGSAIE